MPLEINTNKADIAGPFVELPPHLQKIMQVRSTTNKTSSMARQAIPIPPSKIITPQNQNLGGTHRIGTTGSQSHGKDVLSHSF